MFIFIKIMNGTLIGGLIALLATMMTNLITRIKTVLARIFTCRLCVRVRHRYLIAHATNQIKKGSTQNNSKNSYNRVHHNFPLFQTHATNVKHASKTNKAISACSTRFSACDIATGSSPTQPRACKPQSLISV